MRQPKAINRRIIVSQGLLYTALLSSNSRPALAKPTSLIFAVSDSAKPLAYIDPNSGIARGIIVDTLALITALAGMAPRIEAYPWQRAQANVSDGSADGFCTLATSARMSYAKFSKHPIYVNQIGLIYERGNRSVENVKSATEMRDLVHASYLGNGYSKEFLSHHPVFYGPSVDQALRMVAAGRADVFLESRAIAMHRIHSLGLGADLNFRTVDFIEPSPFCIGLRRSLPDCDAILDVLDQATETIRADKRMAKIVAEYLRDGAS
jgi:polar amino acid transport system substrate-binding protein